LSGCALFSIFPNENNACRLAGAVDSVSAAMLAGMPMLRQNHRIQTMACFLMLAPLLAVAPSTLGKGKDLPSEPPLVAVAANMRPAFEAIAERFRQRSGHGLRPAYGSSGNIARQIEQGARFEIFLSADEDRIRQLEAAGRTDGESAIYAIGRLAIVAPIGSGMAVDGELEGLRRALADGAVQRFAIANPEHAPYGQAAKEALQRAGLWSAIERKLVYGENISQAAQYASTSATQGGIIAYALALSEPIKSSTRSALIPQHWHAPLLQRMALLRCAGPVAHSFFAFLKGEEARAVLERHGYGVPGVSG
jgi:molybdate transport system substrate-binding protein